MGLILAFLKRLTPGEIAGIALTVAFAALMGVQVHKTHAAQHELAATNAKLVTAQQTIINYQQAAEKARQLDAENKVRAEAEQRVVATSGQTGASSISLSSTGENFGAGFAQGIEKKSTMDKVVSAAKGIAKIAKGIVDDWLDINSPSREMEDSGGWFSLGFAKGIVGKTKQVASSAKDLAMTAKDSLNQFLEGFELPDGDNELHFKAVVDYEAVDPSRFGRINPVSLRPNLSFTNGLASSVKTSKYVAPTVDTSSSNKQNEQSTTQSVKQPAVIQVVTPEKRELARWLVDDITDFQDFKIARSGQF